MTSLENYHQRGSCTFFNQTLIENLLQIDWYYVIITLVLKNE